MLALPVFYHSDSAVLSLGLMMAAGILVAN